MPIYIARIDNYRALLNRAISGSAPAGRTYLRVLTLNLATGESYDGGLRLAELYFFNDDFIADVLDTTLGFRRSETTLTGY
ncbi:MAG: hypothetical protein WBG62_16125, partial [Cyclobacteriaceae bacterium]